MNREKTGRRTNGSVAQTSKSALPQVFKSASCSGITLRAALLRADLEIGDTADLEVCATGADWLVWQLIDSAFPTGGFAHSVGLEAAWQHGEVRNRAELLLFLETSLRQLGRSALPFVTAAWDEPDRVPELEELFDVYTTNHVANRASRLQGRAFLSAIERIFPGSGQERISGINGAGGSKRPDGLAVAVPALSHFAPVFGGAMRRLFVSRTIAARMFFFSHLRSALAAAVRLNITGPMEAQILQRRLSLTAEQVLDRCRELTLAEVSQTAPLLDLWQGAQDRLYSRLFQS